ncbi:TIGR02117 family protein [Nitratidesulfovibrio liaohensis]|uniref:TIGR02117 family protein n=1 Tax=Nitratidesulfovibrio liaohensis TaxID=2604158 RepID=A0ABY9QZY8_9BACT|nr:TIGR02117 family protein [Nitratidesulfovibrio liaohensis]WMW65090.1 TIGR02117 family protein [Nitratidesulfovibrio liaohensis]
MPPRPTHPGQPPKPPRRPLRHILTWTLRGLVLLSLGYLLAVAVLGAMPRPTEGLPSPACCLPGSAVRNATEQRNGTTVPIPPESSGTPGSPDGKNAGVTEAVTRNAPSVTIHVISNGVHADIVLPARVEGEPGLADVLGLDGGTGGAKDGPPALAALPGKAHVAIGWGAREFYLATPTWDRIRPGVALRALAPAPAALHVEVMPGPPLPDADTRTLQLSRQGYRNLVAFVAASLRRDAEGRPVRIPVTPENGDTGYGPGSLFLEATGRFSPLRTCNTWAADALAAAGVRAPMWTPLPHFVLYHLPATDR